MSVKESVGHPMNIISCCHTRSPSSGPGTALRAVACVTAFVGTEEGRRMSSALAEPGTVTLLGFTQSGGGGGAHARRQASRVGGACTES